MLLDATALRYAKYENLQRLARFLGVPLTRRGVPLGSRQLARAVLAALVLDEQLHPRTPAKTLQRVKMPR